MAFTTVEVPGYGEVDFPDTMSDDEITTAIKRDILKQKIEPPIPTLSTAIDKEIAAKTAPQPVVPEPAPAGIENAKPINLDWLDARPGVIAPAAPAPSPLLPFPQAPQEATAVNAPVLSKNAQRRQRMQAETQQAEEDALTGQKLMDVAYAKAVKPRPGTNIPSITSPVFRPEATAEADYQAQMKQFNADAPFNGGEPGTIAKRNLAGRTIGEVQSRIHDVTEAITTPLKNLMAGTIFPDEIPKSYASRLGARYRETLQNLEEKGKKEDLEKDPRREQIKINAQKKIDSGRINLLTEDEQRVIRADRGFWTKVGEVVGPEGIGGMIAHPVQSVAGLVLGIIEDPEMLLAGEGLGLALRGMKSAGLAYKIGRATSKYGEEAGKLAKTESVLTKTPLHQRIGENLIQNAGAVASTNYPLASSRAEEYGPSQAARDIGIGLMLGGHELIKGHLEDTRISKRGFNEAAKVADLAGAEAHPDIGRMLPMFQAISKSLEDAPFFKIHPEARTMTAEEAALHYKMPLEEVKKQFGEEVAVGGNLEADKATITLHRAADPATVVEETWHYLENRLNEEATAKPDSWQAKLKTQIDVWDEAVRKEAETKKISLPKREELIVQVMTANMGYAKNLNKNLSRIEVPKTIMDGLGVLMGHDPALRGLDFPGEADLGKGVTIEKPSSTPTFMQKAIDEEISKRLKRHGKNANKVEISKEAAENFQARSEDGTLIPLLNKNAFIIDRGNSALGSGHLKFDHDDFGITNKQFGHIKGGDIRLQAFGDIFGRLVDKVNGRGYLPHGDEFNGILANDEIAQAVGREAEQLASEDRLVFFDPSGKKTGEMSGYGVTWGHGATPELADAELIRKKAAKKLARGDARTGAATRRGPGDIPGTDEGGRGGENGSPPLPGSKPKGGGIRPSDGGAASQPQSEPSPSVNTLRNFLLTGKRVITLSEEEAKHIGLAGQSRQSSMKDMGGRIIKIAKPGEAYDSFEKMAERANEAIQRGVEIQGFHPGKQIEFNDIADAMFPGNQEQAVHQPTTKEFYAGDLAAYEAMTPEERAAVDEKHRTETLAEAANLKPVQTEEPLPFNLKPVAQQGLFGGEKKITEKEKPPVQEDMFGNRGHVASQGKITGADKGLEGTALQEGADRAQIEKEQTRLFNLKPGEKIAPEPESEKKARIFYSQLIRTVEQKMPNAAPPDNIRRLIRSTGVKEDEIKWTGLDEFLAGKEKVTKAELLKHLEENQVQVQEVVKGESNRINRKSKYAIPEVMKIVEQWQGNADDALWLTLQNDGDAYRALTKKFPELAENEDWAEAVAKDVAGGLQNAVDTKFTNYQTPGGENYRELLLTLPSKAEPAKELLRSSISEKAQAMAYGFGDTWELLGPNGRQRYLDQAERFMEKARQDVSGDFKSSHFDEPNILAHVRFNERTVDGKKVLFLEEVQSDWGQSLRKSAPLREVMKPDNISNVFDNTLGTHEFPGPALNEMDASMLATTHHDQISGAIISILPVNMVNNLKGGETTAKNFFRNPSVILKSMSADARSEWLTAIVNASRTVETSFRAKLANAIKTGKDVEILPAFNASDLSAREAIGLLAPHTIYGSADIGAKSIKTTLPASQAEFLNSKLSTGVGTDAVNRGSASFKGEDGAASVAEALEWHNKILRDKNRSTKNFSERQEPPMPFEKTWHELMLRRMLRWSAENGFDRLAWASGEMQAARYDLSKQVNSVIAAPFGGESGKIRISMDLKNGRKHIAGDYNLDELPGVVGKDLAEKIAADIPNMGDKETLEYSGLDLKVGGEGMKTFYDKMIPQYLDKYGKKWGAKVEPTMVDVTDYGARGKAVVAPDAKPGLTETVQSIPITESMRKSVMEEGQPLFNLKPGENLPAKDVAKELEKRKNLSLGIATGHPPRVEEKVSELRKTEAQANMYPAVLSRDKPRHWKDLDPEVNDLLDKTPDQDFYNIIRRRNLSDVEVMAWDARVQAKSEWKDAALEKFQAESDPEKRALAKADYVGAAFDYALAGSAQRNNATETARALAAHARIMAARGSPTDLLMRHLIRALPKAKADDLARLITAFETDPASFPELLRRSMKIGNLDKALELWKAGLLSSPSTDIANMVGNTLNHFTNIIEAGASGLADKALQAIHGGKRMRYVEDAAAELSGTLEAMPSALSTFAKNMKDVAMLKDKPLDLAQKFEFQTGAVGGTLGKVARTSFRKLEVEDQLAKDIIGSAERRKLSIREARKELGGDVSRETILNRAKQIEEGILKGDDAYTDLRRQVLEVQKTRTFQGDGGPIAKGIMRINQQAKLMQLVFPFVKTPANILDVSVQRSPLGFVKAGKAYKRYFDARKAGEPAEVVDKLRGEVADAIGRASVGTGIMLSFGLIAKAGLMTGGGPSDTKKKQLLMETGWQPYSFKIPVGGKTYYIPFSRFDPLASALGVVADMGEIKDEKTGSEVFNKAMQSVVSNLANKTYLQALSQVAAVLSPTQSEYASGRFINSLAGSVVPNVIAHIERATDTVVRSTKGSKKGIAGVPEEALNTIKSRIPGLSTSLPPRRAITGGIMERPGLSWLERFASPAPITVGKEGVASELVKIDFEPPTIERTLRLPDKSKVLLSDKEMQDLADARKEGSDAFMEMIKSNPDYEGMDIEDKQQMAKEAFAGPMGDAKEKIKYARMVETSGTAAK